MKIGELDIKKAYFGAKELTPNNAYLGDVPIKKNEGIPNDEIWYTSLDGKVVSPYSTVSIPPIISNTYNDGKGIIKCDRDITYIGDTGFLNCSTLTSIEIPNSFKTIGNNAFGGCDALTSIIVSDGNTKYDSRDNCNAIIETTINKLVVGCKNTVIPNSVTDIGYRAFNGSIGLITITIPNSVTNIGISAFENCSGLTSVTIPNSVTNIGSAAFRNCKGLTSVIIGNKVTSIEYNAFRDCKGLTSISYTGTIAQYTAITKGKDWHVSVPATVVHCTDGDVNL